MENDIFELKSVWKETPTKVRIGVKFGKATDCMKRKKGIIELQAFNAEDGCPETRITTVFEDYLKFCWTYIDTNNNPNIEEFLQKNNIGYPTKFLKPSVYCVFPCYFINPTFIKERLSENDWKKYLGYFKNKGDENFKIPTLEELQNSFDTFSRQLKVQNLLEKSWDEYTKDWTEQDFEDMDKRECTSNFDEFEHCEFTDKEIMKELLSKEDFEEWKNLMSI